MIRLTLNTMFFLLMSLSIFSQTFKLDSTTVYQKKSLTFEEANIVSSYYRQDGNHSAITGGVGTEKLTDIANVIDFKLSRTTMKGKKYTYGGELGIDYYTSASSDNIDTRVSSASSQDVRVYPSLNYTVENLNTGISKGGNLAFSKEYDYTSIGGGLKYSKVSKNKNTEFGARANVFLDTYSQIVPSEFRSNLPARQQKKGEIGNAARNTYDLSLMLSQVLTHRIQMSLTVDVNYQNGLLSTPFHRVYMSDGSLLRETLPDKRFKIPIGLRANYFLSNKLIIRSFYRYYQDDWGMKAHTVQIEMPYKVSQYLSVSPFYRYHHQTAIDYFAPKGQNAAGSEFFSSDYDLSGLSSKFYGVGLRTTPFKMITDKIALTQIELRGGLYNRSDGMNAGIITLHLQVKKI
ncbi:MAG: DUF3570 domain-containing protein [Saprospiraceae bacterium]